MPSIDSPYYLNGDEPQIVGSACEAFYLLQHQIDGAISDPANVAYLKFPCGWVRLYFDGNTIFWRNSEEPLEPINDRVSSMLVLANLSEMKGVIGSVLQSIEYWGTASEVGSRLFFTSGKVLSFRHLADNDRTLCNG